MAETGFMAVYTVLEEQDFHQLLKDYGIGRLCAFRGISEGIENSNYLLTVTAPASGTKSEYVLTIAETQAEQDIRFIAQLLTAWHNQGLPVPAPIPTRDGDTVVLLRGKPAVLIPKIEGDHPVVTTLGQNRAIGSALGRLHQAALAGGLQHTSHRNLGWIATTAETLRDSLSPADSDLLERGLTALALIERRQPALPQAVVHGDLFRDNTLFQGDRLNAIIDFFSAGTGYLFFDLAVVVNDWCMIGDTLDRQRLSNLLEAYRQHRSPCGAEQDLWPMFLQVAALRFWVSRLLEQRNRAQTGIAPGALLINKDPDQYKAILAYHLSQPTPWPLD